MIRRPYGLNGVMDAIFKGLIGRAQSLIRVQVGGSSSYVRLKRSCIAQVSAAWVEATQLTMFMSSCSAKIKDSLG